jgi:hypothetical protein
MFGLCLDQQLGGGEPVRREATDELVSKPYGNKSQGVGPVGRWIEHPADHEVRWRVPELERALVEAPGEPVGKTSFGAKSRQDRTLVQLGELTERADPEPAQHFGEHGQAENLDFEVCEPLRRGAVRHDHAFARGEPCSKRAVRDPHPAWRLGGCAAGRIGDCHDSRGHRGADLLDKQGLPTEITGRRTGRKGTDPGPGELHPGCEARDRPDYGLEAARVPGRLLVHHDELRATRLGLPAPLAETHPFGPGSDRGGDHPVGGEDGSRPAGEPGSNYRPVGTPDDEGADRGHH